MHHTIRFAAAGLMVAAGCVHAQDTTTHETRISLGSVNFSDVAPIKQVIEGLEGSPIGKGDHAFSHSQLELSQHWHNWEIAAFWRYDYYLQFKPDTAQLIYLNKNRQPHESGRVYDVYLNANHLRSKGLGLGYRYDILSTLSVRGRANYLTSEEMQDGTIRGAVATQAGTYSGVLDLGYDYSEDKLLKRGRESVSGRGWSLDFDVNWQLTDQVRGWLLGRDVYAEINWKNLPFTRATATTDRARYQPDGTITFRPAVSGIESYRNHTQRLPARYKLGASFDFLPNWSAEAELFTYDDQLFPRAALNWHLRYATLQASYDFGAEAVGVGVVSRFLRVLLRTDDPDYRKARALELQLAAQVAF